MKINYDKKTDELTIWFGKETARTLTSWECEYILSYYNVYGNLIGIGIMDIKKLIKKCIVRNVEKPQRQ